MNLDDIKIGNYIKISYVDDVDDDILIYAIVSGMQSTSWREGKKLFKSYNLKFSAKIVYVNNELSEIKFNENMIFKSYFTGEVDYMTETEISKINKLIGILVDSLGKEDDWNINKSN